MNSRELSPADYEAQRVEHERSRTRQQPDEGASERKADDLGQGSTAVEKAVGRQVIPSTNDRDKQRLVGDSEGDIERAHDERDDVQLSKRELPDGIRDEQAQHSNS